jgi:putative glutamine amidotransferase
MAFSRPPRILVTAKRGSTAEEYCDALREAGAEPLLVAPGEAPPALGEVAGLLVTGGGDVDPGLYAGQPELAEGVDRERDALESALLRDARERRLPTLCICRGLQIANVVFGGSLIGDIPASAGGAATIPHERCGADGAPDRGVIDEHVVRIAPGSLLARTAHMVNLSTDDGVIEALEAKFESPFWLAVQWHPESTRGEDAGASRAIFRAFVAAAASGAALDQAELRAL